MFEWWRNLPLLAPEDEGAGGGGDGGDGGEGQGQEGAAGDGKGGPGDGEGGGKASLLDRAKPAEDDSESAALGKEAGEGDAKGEDGEPPKFVFKERPAWLPEEFFDKETGEARFEKLAQSRQDLRAKMGKGEHKAPEKPEGYKVDIPEDLKEAAERVLLPDEETGEDPLVTEFRSFAHERNISQETFNDIVSWFVRTTEAFTPPPIDQDAELRKLGSNSQAMIDQTLAFGDRLRKTGAIGDAEYEEFRLTCASAAGVKLINAIRSSYGEQPVALLKASETAGGESAADLAKQQGDIARDLAAGKISEEEANRRQAVLDKKFERTYGTEPAGSSVVAS